MDDPPIDDEYLYELYHKNVPPLVSPDALAPAENRDADADATDADATGDGSAPEHKRYRRAEAVPIAETASSEFLDALDARASYSSPTTARPITDVELFTLLKYAYGERRVTDDGEPRRPVPSGGARYPLELYPVVVSSPDLTEGLYHFDVREDAVERVRERSYADWVAENWTWVSDRDEVSAVVLVTARPERSASKYDELGYLFAAIEAGAVLQNLQLVAAHLGLGSRPHNGVNYAAVREELALREEELFVTSLVLAGEA